MLTIVPYKRLTDCHDLIGKVLSDMVELGVVFQHLKASLVVLLDKPNKDKTSVNSVRPISLLNTLAEISGRLVMTRLKMEIGDRVCKNQYGFNPFTSTENLLYDLC